MSSNEGLSWSRPQTTTPKPAADSKKKWYVGPDLYWLSGVMLFLSWKGAHYVWGDGHGMFGSFLSLWWFAVSGLGLFAAVILFIAAIGKDHA